MSKKKKKYPKEVKIGKHLYTFKTPAAEKEMRELYKAHKSKKYWRF